MNITTLLAQAALVLLLTCTAQAQTVEQIASESAPATTTIKTAAQNTRFVVYYMGDPSQELENKDSYLRTFMDVYQLKVVNTFEVTEESKGFTLQATEHLDLPNVTAKELSLIDGVIMIEVVYTKPTTQS